MHNHIIPGIDDGSPDTDTSIALLRGMNQLGYKNFVFTSHIYLDIYPNNHETIGNAFATLTPLIRTQLPDLRVRFGAEHMLDDDFSKKLEAKESMLCLKDKNILIECSFAMPPIDFDNKIFQLQLHGYQPILAHPERYSYWHREKNLFEDLYLKGVQMQTNILSLGGYYGEPVKHFAERMVEKKMISYLGTDLHHEKHLDRLQNLNISTKVVAQLEQNKLLNRELFA